MNDCKEVKISVEKFKNILTGLPVLIQELIYIEDCLDDSEVKDRLQKAIKKSESLMNDSLSLVIHEPKQFVRDIKSCKEDK